MTDAGHRDVAVVSREHGLLPYLFDLPDPHSRASDTVFLDRVAALVSNGEVPLRTEGDAERMAALAPAQFFAGLPVINRLIPRLGIGHREMMNLVDTLVRLGGGDLAATTPNGAFREWCVGHEDRVQAVLDDARAGDATAVDLLCFALEAGHRSADALEFLKSGDERSVVAAAVALDRMQLDPAGAAEAVAVLGDACAHADDVEVLGATLLSAWGVLGQHPDLPRQGAVYALDAAAAYPSPEARHAVASLLVRHGSALTPGELAVALDALKQVDPKHKGTIDQIDQTSRPLTAGGWFEQLADVVGSLIRQSGGALSLEEFPRFWVEVARDGYQRLSAVAVRWLLDVDPALAASLSKRLSRVLEDHVTLDLSAEDLPADADSQRSLCRKAVGFLFLTPITAASVLVSVIEHGLPEVEDEAASLLDDPLLLNFGGELARYLGDAAGARPKPVADRLEAALKNAEDTLAGLEGIVELRELHPSGVQRRADRIHEARAMAEAVKMGSKKSIFDGLFRQEHLLYGRNAAMYVEDPGGGMRKIDVELAEHSVSMEIPRMAILDPEGLEIRLWQLKSGAAPGL